MRPTILLATFAAALALTGTASAAGNPFGISVVRFTHGTTPAQMRSAVSSAGGVVVTDLSAIDALGVLPRSTSFTARLSSNRAVAAVFQDSMLSTDAQPDTIRASGRSSSPGDVGLSSFVADPWHDLSSFLGVTNPEGILQWDDGRMNVAPAWRTTTGDRSVGVAVLDTGVDPNHRELRGVLDPNLGGNFIPCDDLKALLGLGAIERANLRDCRDGDFEGHGTWVASRIAGASNGFASNGVAPGVTVGSYKVLAAGLGGLSTWILSGLVAACSSPRVDLVNMSIEGYFDPADPFDAEDYLLFADALSYCSEHGVAVFAAAGNQHVRVDEVTLSLGGRTLAGAGRVSGGAGGIATVAPGSDTVADYDLHGLLPVGGVPGMTMVSATANAIGAAPVSVPLRWQQHVGARDQLAYYSNYGSRVGPARLLLELRLPRRPRRARRRAAVPDSRLRRRGGRRPLRRLGQLRRPRRRRPDLQRPVRRLAVQLGVLRRARPGLRLAPGNVDVGAQRGRRGGAHALGPLRPPGPPGCPRLAAGAHDSTQPDQLHGPERRRRHGAGARRDPVRDGLLPRRPAACGFLLRRLRRGFGRRACSRRPLAVSRLTAR
jgi:hypothetical protein